jgi:hypothetical protein
MSSRLRSVPVLILLLGTSSGLDAAARRPFTEASQPAVTPAPQAKPSRTSPRAPKKAKPAKAGKSKAAAPCDTPAPAAAAVKKPQPVPADPLAPVVAPCPGTTH